MTTQKKRVIKTILTKSFRLFDFNIYDEFPGNILNTMGSDSDESTTKQPKETRKFVIQMFGINEQGKTCCIYVSIFLNHFFYTFSHL